MRNEDWAMLVWTVLFLLGFWRIQSQDEKAREALRQGMIEERRAKRKEPHEQA